MISLLELCSGSAYADDSMVHTCATLACYFFDISAMLGNVQLNWPILFQAFSVKFTLIFFMSAFIQSFHISACKNDAFILMQNYDLKTTLNATKLQSAAEICER